MASLMTGYAETGITTGKFVRRRLSDGAFWNTSGTPAFEAYSAGSIANYGIAATEITSSGVYTATDPATTIPGDYLFVKATTSSLAVADLTTGIRWQDSTGNTTLADVQSRLPASIPTFPSNFASLGITAGGKISGVVLTDTLTTYTGNTVQTGDSYARLGAPAGASVSADIATKQATLTTSTGVTFPTTVASTTNITGGTITTTTNLTNAPTSGDFTATMKTSLNAATPASVVGAVGSVTAGVTLAANQHVIVDSGTVTTLTNLPAITTDWISAAGVSAAAVTKIQAGLSTFSGGAVSSVTGNVGGNVVGSVGSVVAVIPRVTLVDTVTTNTDMRGTDNASLATTALSTAVWTPTKAGYLDTAVSGVAASVWGQTTRTLSSFGTLVTDIATAVWGAAARTLTAFGFTVATNSDTGVSSIVAKLPTNTIADETLVIAATNAIMTRLGTPSTSSLAGDVAAIPSATVIADTTLRRHMSSVESSGSGESISISSIYGMIQMGQKAGPVSGTSLPVYKTDGVTVLDTLVLTVSATANPITGVSI